MRVFSQINNCQQKQNKKQNKKQKQKTDKTKRGAPLLGLAKSISYIMNINNGRQGIASFISPTPTSIDPRLSIREHQSLKFS